MKNKKLFTWILIGLLCRFILMPFTLHPDMLHIYYHPYFLAFKGIWNIYNYHADFFEEYHSYYYAPLTYLFFGAYLYLTKPFLPGVDEFMEGVGKVNYQCGGHSGHYLMEIANERLFRFLFLMKLPYLLFDIALLLILLRFTLHQVQPCTRRDTGILKWWALNPLLIYACYLLGQFDIIPTFLIALAAFLAFKGKNAMAMIFLGCGAALKSFPLFLIFPFSFYLGRDVKGIIKYAFMGVLPLLIIVGPFYFLSEGKVMGTFFSQRITQGLTFGMIRSLIFISGYLFLCLSLVKKSIRERLGRLGPVKISFFTLALLFISFPISFHYFVWMTPFILILGTTGSRPRIMHLYLLAVFSLALSTLIGKGMWMGLFSPIYPEFFMGLPGLDEVIKRLLPYTLVKRISTCVFITTLAWMSIIIFKEREA